MNIKITKGARQYGYLIWNSKSNNEIEIMLMGLDSIKVHFNEFDLGREKY